MLQQFYFVEFRGMAEGDLWETYKNRRGVLACYGNYGTACDAAYKLEQKFPCVRVVRNDGVVLFEHKTLFKGGVSCYDTDNNNRC